MLWIWILLLVVALAMLIKGADWFTEGAEAVGVRLGMSPFVVGVTIVSIGTSLPELASSIAAVLADKSEIVLGNVVGSNIANILFVLGLGAVVAKGMETKWDIAKVDLPILFGATCLLILTVLDGIFSFFEAIIFLVFFVAYIYYTLTSKKKKSKVDVKLKGARSIVALIGGVLLVTLGAHLLIKSVVGISTLVGISAAIISASVVAFGTSVPEAVVTIVAALKGKKDIAMGNIVGSNIFNILFIMGVAGLFGNLVVDTVVLTYALPILVAATLIFWFVAREKKVTRKEGIAMLAFYIIFLILLYIMSNGTLFA